MPTKKSISTSERHVYVLTGVKDGESSPVAMMGVPHFVGGW
jgi:hypothetical protein